MGFFFGGGAIPNPFFGAKFLVIGQTWPKKPNPKPKQEF
jgi:hypothetical protein